ncbi:unnamed protein product [Mycena citricolor]|uniref:Uncharacterized protein n=1 Tax=Mycena citricolor TaxID=2018698 RepID=A0AAD2H8U0_9AGAR|nr:unnamed protein product [Mycena citricolor]
MLFHAPEGTAPEISYPTHTLAIDGTNSTTYSLSAAELVGDSAGTEVELPESEAEMRMSFEGSVPSSMLHSHFIYECKWERPYVSRPSRTEMLENPSVLAKLKASGKPSIEVPEEFKKKEGTANRILEAKEKEREVKDKGKGKEREPKKARRSSRSSSDSESDSDSSRSSSSDSDSDSSGSESDSDRSRERNSRRRVPRRRASSARSRSRSH